MDKLRRGGVVDLRLLLNITQRIADGGRMVQVVSAGPAHLLSYDEKHILCNSAGVGKKMRVEVRLGHLMKKHANVRICSLCVLTLNARLQGRSTSTDKYDVARTTEGEVDHEHNVRTIREESPVG